MAQEKKNSGKAYARLQELLASGQFQLFPEYRRKVFPGPDYDTVQYDDIKGIDVYTRSPEHIQQLSRANVCMGEPLMQDDPNGGVIAKFRLQPSLAEQLLKDGNGLTTGNPYHQHGLYRLKLPGGYRMALSSIMYNDEQADALIIRARTHNVNGITRLLSDEGFLPKKPPYKGYDFSMSEDGEGVVAAVVIPPSIADAIRNTQDNEVVELAELAPEARESMSLKDVVALAAEHLEAIERAGPQATRRKKGQAKPETEPVKQGLSDYADLLAAHVKGFERERRLDGGFTYRIRIGARDDQLVKLITSPQKTESPVSLHLTDDRGPVRRYSLSQQDYSRLKQAVPDSANLPDEELAASLAEQHLAAKYDPERGRYSALTDIYFSATRDGQHYMTVVGESRSRLAKFLQSLPAKQEPMQPHFLSADDEEPAVLRLIVPAAIIADIASQPFHARTKEVIRFHFEEDSPYDTVKALDEAIRSRLKVARPYVEPEPAIEHKKEKKAKETKKKLNYGEQQEAEAEFLDALVTLAERQEDRDDVLCSAFVNLHQKKESKPFTDWNDLDDFGKPKRKTLQFEYVEPTLFLEVRNSVYQQFLETEPGWRREYVVEEDKGGDYRWLAITLGPEGMNRARELFRTAPVLNREGKPEAVSLDDTKEANGLLKENFLIDSGSIKHRLNNYFNDLKKDAKNRREVAEKGFSDKERSIYNKYMRWKENPAHFEEPTDQEKRLVEDRLAEYKHRVARARAFAEIASKDLRVVDVMHLADEELASVEATLNEIEGYAASIGHISALAEPVAKKLEILRENSRIHGIHPDIGRQMEMAEHRTRQLRGIGEDMQEYLGEIAGQIADYRRWVESLAENREAKQVLVLRATRRTAELLDAICDQAHMTRNPVMMHNAIGEGRDIMMLFPTDATLDEVQQAIKAKQTNGSDVKATIKPLAAQPLGAEEVIAYIKKEFGSQEEPAKPKTGSQETVQSIVNKLRSPLESVKPLLVQERVENPYPNKPAAEEIGTQHVITFTISRKRDLKPVMDIMQTLQRYELLVAPKRYGGLVTGSARQSDAQERILALKSAENTVDTLDGFFSNLEHHAKAISNGTESQAEFSRMAVADTLAEIGTRLHACHSLCDDLEARGILVECAALSKLAFLAEKSPDALSSDDWQSAFEGLQQLRQELGSIKRLHIRDALEAYGDEVEHATKGATEQHVSVRQLEGALLSDGDMPVSDLDMHHRLHQGGSAYMLKLYVNEDVWKAIDTLAQRQKGKFTKHNPNGDKALAPSDIARLWAEKGQSVAGRG